jgi:phosphoenolpyruvate carboxylase
MKSPHDPRLVAVDLALLLLQTMQEPEKPGQPARTQSPEVNAALTGWINTHWRSAGDAQDPQADRAAEAALLAITNPKERDFCLRFMARAGHLYQIAAQASAAGYMATMNTNPVADFLKAEGRRPYTNAKQAVEALNKPAFELTLTAHPTNTSSVPSMMEERSLGLALQAMQTDSGATIPLRDAMKSYANSDIVPMKDGRPRNISVLEETDYMLHYLVTAYEELPALYKPYDDALSKLKDYNQHDLKLKVKFHSWGSSGDKDGNKNVNAASTLYAIAAHYDTMLEMYARDLNYLATDKQGADSKITILDPELQAWDARIRTAREAAASARFFAKEAFTGKKPVSAQELEKKQQELATAVSALDQNALLQALDNYPHKPNIDVGRTQRALDTTRRLRTFGFTLGHLEYRETSEVFTRITKEL